MTLLARYVLKELLPPFVFALFLFLSVFVGGNILTGLTQLITETGMSLGEAFRFFWLSVPRFVTYSFPMALLAAALWAYGRLSGEQELTAMRVGGYSLRRAALPALCLATGVSVFAIAFNELVVPPANRAARALRLEVQGMPGQVQEHVLLTQVDGAQLEWLIYLYQFYPAEARFAGLFSINPREQIIVRADQGRWRGNDWLLQSGEVERVARGTAVATVLPFTQLTARAAGLGLDSPANIARRSLKPREMSWSELRAYLRQMPQRNPRLGFLRWELHNKLAIPFASLVFALVAIPLGMRPGRGGSWLKAGFAVPIIVAYYVLWTLLGVAAERALLPPVAAAWTPNVLIALVGVVMLLRSR